MKDKRRCKTCGRVLADANKSDLCFAHQPAELPKFEQRGGADVGGEDYNEYQRQYYRMKRRAAAI